MNEPDRALLDAPSGRAGRAPIDETVAASWSTGANLCFAGVCATLALFAFAMILTAAKAFDSAKTVIAMSTLGFALITAGWFCLDRKTSVMFLARQGGFAAAAKWCIATYFCTSMLDLIIGHDGPAWAKSLGFIGSLALMAHLLFFLVHMRFLSRLLESRSIASGAWWAAGSYAASACALVVAFIGTILISQTTRTGVDDASLNARLLLMIVPGVLGVVSAGAYASTMRSVHRAASRWAPVRSAIANAA